ncbi:MAG: AgmX/PglI C-terminal domain-containing protein [Myxococcales bacterium]|nr:AgmX/PglI C-terminal domain-containing protein [Myxococcales bacterium]
MSSSSPFANGSNPFLTSGAQNAFGEVSDPVDGKETYAMIPTGSVSADEVETTAAAVEVIVRWDESILHIDHIAPGKAFSVGEEACDVVVPADKLGAPKAALVAGDCAIVLPGATARISSAGRSLELTEAVAEGLAVPSTSLTGAYMVRLTGDVRVKSSLNGFSFEVASVQAGRKVAGKGRGDKKAFGAQALSFGLHGAIAAALFAFMPALASTEDGSMSDDQKYLLKAIIQAEAEKEKEQPDLKGGEDMKAADAGESGAAAPGEKGSVGSTTAPAANKRYSVTGGAPERTLNRAEALADAQQFGLIAQLAGMPNGPTSPWGDVANGPDAFAANGNVFGNEAGDAFGNGGLDISGTGIGGGGRWNGIGMDGIGTAGRGSGDCVGDFCNGFGKFNGRLSKGHPTGSPKVRLAPPTLSGRLPPEVIQRVVRQNFGRFRACYENGLRSNPNLTGRVSVAFTIGRDGAIGGAQNAGSDLPDAGVVSCVVKQFYGLSFPAPEAGVVTVSYPISFSPN